MYAAQQEPVEKDNEEDTYQLVTIMNADGIYLATYAALLLNLKLIRVGYYEDQSRQVPINEVKTLFLKFWKIFVKKYIKYKYRHFFQIPQLLKLG